MDSSVSPKDEIWFLRVCHHISNAVYTRGMEQAVRVRKLGDATQGLLYPYLSVMHPEISVYLYFIS
jgi:hypothetical protein